MKAPIIKAFKIEATFLIPVCTFIGNIAIDYAVRLNVYVCVIVCK